MNEEVPTCTLPNWNTMQRRLASVDDHGDPDIGSFYALLQPLAGCRMESSLLAFRLNAALADYAKLSPGTENVLKGMFRRYLRVLIDNNKALNYALEAADALGYHS